MISLGSEEFISWFSENVDTEIRSRCKKIAGCTASRIIVNRMTDPTDERVSDVNITIECQSNCPYRSSIVPAMGAVGESEMQARRAFSLRVDDGGWQHVHVEVS